MMNQMQWLCVRPVHRAASVHLNLILVINRILKFVKGSKNSVCRILKVDFYRISKTDCLIRQTGFWRLIGSRGIETSKNKCSRFLRPAIADIYESANPQ